MRARTLGGWLVRTADGYTKRANSANWIAPDPRPAATIVAGCSAIFEGEGLRPTFRIVERGETDAVERHLADAGWQSLDTSLVMSGDAGEAFPAGAGDSAWSVLPMSDWAAIHARFAGQDKATAQRHLRLLSRIAQPAFPAVLTVQDEAVACGLAVAEGPLLGFFDIVTSAEHRGRGYARRLMAGQVEAARRLGVNRLYLQVVAANAPAIALYRKLGFRETYRYHYRLR